MAIKSSGFLKFSEIQSEFGGANPISISEYYRGRLVPNGVSQNNIVPVSGIINLGKFYNTVRVFVFNKTISTSVVNYNVKNDAIANGWDGIIPLIATIVINSGVVITSASTGTPAFTSDTLPTNSRLTVTNSGSINGRPGVGGAGGTSGSLNGANGGVGGASFRTNVPTTLNNLGTLAGGGGGRGGQGSGRVVSIQNQSSCTGGIGCFSTQYTSSINCANDTGAVGATGTSNGANGLVGSSGGFGAVTTMCPGCTPLSTTLTCTGSVGAGGAGGVAGPAVIGNANITYTNTGTRLGAIT